MGRNKFLLTSIILSVLAFSLSGLIFWRLNARAQATPQLDPAGVDIVLYPTHPSSSLLDTIRFDLVAFPNGNQLSATEVHLTFDPTQLLPNLPTAVIPNSYLSQLLPNCDASLPESNPCLATHSATLNSLTAYLGVTCQGEENGPVICSLPPTNQPFIIASFDFIPVATQPGQLTVAVQDPTHPSLTAAFTFDTDATRFAHAGKVTLTPCTLSYDFNGSGEIDILDVMAAATIWNRGLDAIAFNPQVDLNRSGIIDITDIQSVASAWNTDCGDE